MTTIEQSKREKCAAIAGTIKGIRAQYQNIDQRLRDARIPHVTINTDTLIKAACRKNGVNEKIVRAIAGWQGLKPGDGSYKMAVIKEESPE